MQRFQNCQLWNLNKECVGVIESTIDFISQYGVQSISFESVIS